MAERPWIDEKKCTGNFKCVEVCPVSVFDKAGKKAKVARPQDCIQCRACEVSCPKGAIKVAEKA